MKTRGKKDGSTTKKAAKVAQPQDEATEWLNERLLTLRGKLFPNTGDREPSQLQRPAASSPLFSSLLPAASALSSLLPAPACFLLFFSFLPVPPTFLSMLHVCAAAYRLFYTILTVSTCRNLPPSPSPPPTFLSPSFWGSFSKIGDDTVEITDCFLLLAKGVKEDPELQARLEKAAPELVELASKHAAVVSGDRRSNSAEAFMAVAALRFLGFFSSQKSVIALLSEPQQQAVLFALVEILQGYALRDKTTMIHVVWCLSMQQFVPVVVSKFVGEITHGISTVIDADFKSSTIAFEAIICFGQLLTQCEDEMVANIGGWAMAAASLLVSEAIKVREKAQELVSTWMPALCSHFNSAGPDASFWSAFSKTFLPRLRTLYDEQSCRVYALQVWGAYVEMLGRGLNKSSSTPLLNHMMALVQRGFSDSPAVVAEAFNAWSILTDVLCMCTAPEDVLPAKKRALLMKPLQKKMKEPLASHSEVQNARARAWWRLVRGLGAHLANNFADVAAPMLETLLVRSSGLGAPTAEAEVLGAEAVYLLLAGEGAAMPVTDDLAPLRQPMPQATVGTWLLPSASLFLNCITANLTSERAETIAMALASFELYCKRLSDCFEANMKNDMVAIKIRGVLSTVAAMAGPEAKPQLKPMVQIALARSMHAVFSFRTLVSNACRVLIPMDTFNRVAAAPQLAGGDGGGAAASDSMVPGGGGGGGSGGGGYGLPATGMRKMEVCVSDLLALMMFSLAEAEQDAEVVVALKQVVGDLVAAVLKTNNPLKHMRAYISRLAWTQPQPLPNQVSGSPKNFRLIPPGLHAQLWLTVAKPLWEHIDSELGTVNNGTDYYPDYTVVTEMIRVASEAILHTAAAKELEVQAELTAGWFTLFNAYARSASLSQLVLSNAHITNVANGLYNALSRFAVLEHWISKPTMTFVTAAIDKLFGAASLDAKRRPYALKDMMIRPIFKIVGITMVKCHERATGYKATGTEKLSVAETFAGVTAMSHCTAYTKILTAWVPKVLVPEMVVEMLRWVGGAVGLILRQTNDKKGLQDTPFKHKPAGHSKLKTASLDLWDALANAIQHQYKGDYNSDALNHLAPLWKNTLCHSHSPIKAKAKALWNATFGQAIWLQYPAPLAAEIIQIRASPSGEEWTFPGWVDPKPKDSEDIRGATSALLAGPTPSLAGGGAEAAEGAASKAGSAGSASEDSEQSQFSIPTSNLIRSPRTKGLKKSFLGKVGSGNAAAAASPKQARSRGRQLQEAAIARASISPPATGAGAGAGTGAGAGAGTGASPRGKGKKPVLKIIAPSPQKKQGPLTEHQKEVREQQRLKRKEQPAEYTSVAGTFGEDTQVEELSETDSEQQGGSPVVVSTADAVLAAAAASSAAAAAATSPLADDNAVSATPAGPVIGSASPPTSILKRRRSGQMGNTAKARRVSFNPQISSTQEIEALPRSGRWYTSAAAASSSSSSSASSGPSSSAPSSAAASASSSSSSSSSAGASALTFVSTRPTAVPAALRQKFTSFSPPPKNLNLSPGGVMLPRSRREQQLLFVAPQGRSPVPKKRTSPLKVNQQDIVTPASVLFESAAARTAVKRNLELAMTPVAGSRKSAAKRSRVPPSSSTAIFPGLGECADQLSHVLPYFHVSNRRAVTQLLAAKKLHTVGDICSMSRDDLQGLPMTVSDKTLTQLSTYQSRQSKAKHSTPSPLGRVSTTSRIPRAVSPDSGPLVPTMQPLEEETGTSASSSAQARASAKAAAAARSAAAKRAAAAAAADSAAGDLLAKSIGQHANASDSSTFAAMGKDKLTAVTGHLERLLASARSGLA